jgi:hypothetical protein
LFLFLFLVRRIPIVALKKNKKPCPTVLFIRLRQALKYRKTAACNE